MPRKARKVRISNEVVNSYGFRLLTSGVDMEQYQRNPVLLYMHERGKVIGTVENIAVEGQDLVGELVFDEVTSKSKEVAAQWDKGSLRMVSAGLSRHRMISIFFSLARQGRQTCSGSLGTMKGRCRRVYAVLGRGWRRLGRE